jgi:hypothetical protein
LLSIGMSFLSHALSRRSDVCEEHGDVFFVVCPHRCRGVALIIGV